MEKTDFQPFTFSKLVDTLIRLGILYLLISWCFDIMRPFVAVIMWGTLVAVAMYPLYSVLLKWLRGRKIISALILVVLLLSVLAIPTWIISESFSKGYEYVNERVSTGQSIIPAPDESVKDWPSITKPVVEFWQLASTDLAQATMQNREQLQEVGKWILGSLRDLGIGLIEFIASILLAGVFLVYSESISKTVQKVYRKLAGDNGDAFLQITTSTIRNVFKGVLGVAFIQATLAGIGFFVAGVPYAGLWTVICLIFAIIQVGVGPVAVPIAIYMFTASDTLTASLLAVWTLVVTMSDNILRPILMGIGSPVPMLVIFIGSIGGFILNGFIGLFLGAVFFALGYNLFLSWIEPSELKELSEENE